jgi:deoxyhypusine synthase
MISSGLRETFRYLVQHKHVSAIVTTAGGIEEDLIKCLAPTYTGSFSAPGAALRARGLNRIGNLLVPNDNYCRFEEWVVPILDAMLDEQEAGGGGSGEQQHWTPSKMIRRLGEEMADERSVCYWAARNAIPIFCPALTDGSLGDMLFFHTFRSASRGRQQQLRIDIVDDIRAINSLALGARRAGMVILGGGVVKHHIANACLMRNGAESAVYVNTAQEFDGSDAGARPDEAVSWGKIRADGDSVKVRCWTRRERHGLADGRCRCTPMLPLRFRSLWRPRLQSPNPPRPRRDTALQIFSSTLGSTVSSDGIETRQTLAPCPHVAYSQVAPAYSRKHVLRVSQMCH